ncbi:DUF2407 C-terminal domain-containing protein [Hypoxylon cercidicola]|nr:DUF2407 C-terminal domain-containing protein [Hypoxylon cercidicola]
MTTSPPSLLPTHLKPPVPAPAPAPVPGPPLLLTIRFSAALPDLELDIPRPGSTTVVSLKHTIRGRLSPPNDRRRLRFIHGGKILPDAAVLSSVLRAPLAPLPPPPRNGSRYGGGSGDDRGKRTVAVGEEAGGGGGGGGGGNGEGKGKGKSVPGRPDPSQRIYVNCSIGDSLTATELAAEATAAAAPPPPPPTPSQLLSPLTTTAASPAAPARSTSAAPRGFDRLLATGFTAAEVNQLRLQFRSIHASRYTPDTLPSPDGFRRMEDAWIDDNGSVPSAAPAATALGGGGYGTDSDDVGLVALVDVMIRGVVTGFVWPLGSAGWLVREEGMASARWRFMVGVGVMFSVLIGIIRSISGDK